MEETEKKKKTKRSIVRRTAKQAAKEVAKKGGSSLVVLRGVPTSTRKMRLVADLIRGERISNALNILKYESKHPSVRLEKLLLSAVSNWELKNSNLKLEEMDLFVKEIYVDGGRALKRLRPAPQGRAHRIRKRSNHVTMIIDSKVEPKLKKEETKKETKKDGTKS